MSCAHHTIHHLVARNQNFKPFNTLKSAWVRVQLPGGCNPDWSQKHGIVNEYHDTLDIQIPAEGFGLGVQISSQEVFGWLGILHLLKWPHPAIWWEKILSPNLIISPNPESKPHTKKKTPQKGSKSAMTAEDFCCITKWSDGFPVFAPRVAPEILAKGTRTLRNI